MTQFIVALRSMSRDLLGFNLSSVHTKLLVATCTCSSLEISADTVRNPASPQNLKNGSNTKKIALSATNALQIVWSGCCSHAARKRNASASALSSTPSALVMYPRARSCLISSFTFDSKSALAESGTFLSSASVINSPTGSSRARKARAR